MKINLLFLLCLGSASAADEPFNAITVKPIDYDFILVHIGALHGNLGEINAYNGACSQLVAKLGGCYGSLSRVAEM